eukprot:251576_1
MTYKHSEPTVKSEKVYQLNIIPPQRSTAAFKCEYCTQEFNLKGSLIKHVYQSHQHSIQTIKSEETQPLTNISATSSQSHTSKPHAGHEIVKFKCYICLKLFQSQSALVEHCHIHSNGQVRCTLCMQSFKFHHDLSEHLRCHCGGALVINRPNPEIQFQSNLRGESFRHQSNLTQRQSIHSDYRQFKCNLCTNLFTRRGDLKHHQCIRTGERQFQCNLCEKSFQAKSTLTRHQ